MKGKSKCKILKDIRKSIAEENDIALVVSECTYQGECSGTCPKCEAEVRYLEKELLKRQRAGKTIVVAGLAATMMASAVACSVMTTQGEPMPIDETWEGEAVEGEFIEDSLQGEPESVDEMWEGEAGETDFGTETGTFEETDAALGE